LAASSRPALGSSFAAAAAASSSSSSAAVGGASHSSARTAMIWSRDHASWVRVAHVPFRDDLWATAASYSSRIGPTTRLASFRVHLWSAAGGSGGASASAPKSRVWAERRRPDAPSSVPRCVR